MGVIYVIDKSRNKTNKQETHICDWYMTNIKIKSFKKKSNENIFITNKHKRYRTHICHCDKRKHGQILKNMG